MAFDVARFKANGIPLGGARPTLFDVILTFPTAALETPDTAGAPEKFMFTCRGAEIPQSQMGTVEVPYFGRKVKLNGDRDFPNWRVRIMNDEDFNVRAALERWHIAINSMVPNVMRPDVASISDGPNLSYKTTAEVRQYRKTGVGGVDRSDADVVRTYILEGIFPVNIGSIRLDWDSTNQIEEYDVEFAFDWFRPIAGIAPRESDEGFVPFL